MGWRIWIVEIAPEWPDDVFMGNIGLLIANLPANHQRI